MAEAARCGIGVNVKRWVAPVVLVGDSGWKVGEGGERDVTESSPQLGKAKGGKATGAKVPGAQYSQETGRIGDMVMGEREIDNMLPGDTTAKQNVMEGVRTKNYSEVVIDGVRRRARMYVGDSIVRNTERALIKGTTWWFACGKKSWVRAGEVLF